MPEPETIDIPALARAYADGDIDLICVLGPTASGKTRYAVQLARALGAQGLPSASLRDPIRANAPGSPCAPKAEILSADSRQVYKGMDIGTGKDLDEYGEVPYHLIDIVPAGSKFNIYEYQAAFADAWADVRSRGCIPILCGGSGLYIESATRAYKFDKENGVPAERLPQKTFYIGTLVSREERVARIDKRLDERLEDGLVEEVKGLLDSGIPAEDLLWYGLEYKFVTQYLLQEISYEEMRILLANAIHQFAKRQMTWFRGMERDGVRIHWVRP
ncbi:MAG: tRNA (adenosine(37)-N6)-dimethylallyltransferase MiaA [Bacteroidales bacterium]|nr:tRNA (adenosine(37)-N6)-dimethylallyltransferase MiaA [Bacteroidales bacterium]